ncbi:MAG: hypothetical protein IJJ69_14760 [Oscillospiraceae bacterium]|nr:hypothetical protein [Oscillospiraceae bacterium]
MKRHKTFLFLMLFSVLCTGCSQAESQSNAELPDLDSIIQQEDSTSSSEITSEAETTQPETSAEPTDIFYLTSHGTETSSRLTKFRTQLETDGFIWNECEISDIPADADILIYNSPTEDLTSDEYQLLKEYMNQGGDLLLLLPASESETRYKFLNLLTESFSFQIDYDRITVPIQDSELIFLQIIGMPDRMAYYDDSMQTTPVYMQNMRSFHMLGDYATDEMFVDVMLQTTADAVGEPFGGTEDDPLTYENEKLNIMVYSRDALRNNAAVVACGASDFLLDENFDSNMSQGAQKWVYSSLNWFINYNKY